MDRDFSFAASADSLSADDGLSDDLTMEMPASIQLPNPELSTLADLENTMRVMSSTPNGRDALTKAIVADEYIAKLTPLVEESEDLESLSDLHRLCNIMKTILLLNDTVIIEQAVSDECVLGVVGALEYDPDFPSHKANHRQWLNSQGRYKEVVKIEDEQIRRKIHQTYRLQYLKDVVLARILDDPTFSVLNSLIFFNQVDIVQHLQNNAGFLSDLFGIFKDRCGDQLRKKEAVLFIQQCCAIAKNLQPPARQHLYTNFLNHGLLHVISFGLRNIDVSVRVGATDILVSMIDHDPGMMRGTIFGQLKEKQSPLTDTLIDLLLVEVDLGIKSQISDALKVLLDPSPPGGPPPEARGGFMAGEVRARPQAEPQQEVLLNYFYEHSAVRLFKPLLDLEKRTEMKFDALSDGVFGYLNDILCFYIRQHQHRSKYFVMNNGLAKRFVQLLACKEKHLQLGKFVKFASSVDLRAWNELTTVFLLVAIRFIRQLVVLQDSFYTGLIVNNQVLGPVLDVLLRTMPRDNLLCSACLDLFGLINKEDMKELIKHLVENYREKIMALSYMDTFREILGRYDQTQGYTTVGDQYFMESEDESAPGSRGKQQGAPPPAGGTRGMMEHLSVDQAQEEYWNTSDDEDEQQPVRTPEHPLQRSASTNGSTTPSRPLVEYNSDEEGDENNGAGANGGDGDAVMGSTGSPPPAGEGAMDEEESTKENREPTTTTTTSRPSTAGSIASVPPPERISEKRRREEDEDDAFDKLMMQQQHKRRNSSSGSVAVGSSGAVNATAASSAAAAAAAAALRKKKSFISAGRFGASLGGGGGKDGNPPGSAGANGPRKIAINLSSVNNSSSAAAGPDTSDLSVKREEGDGDSKADVKLGAENGNSGSVVVSVGGGKSPPGEGGGEGGVGQENGT